MDLPAQYRSLRDQIDPLVQGVAERAAFILGPEVDAFEKAFARFIGANEAVGVSSGTDALKLALLACGIGPGDEVITVPNTYIATCEAITHAGATFRWVDVDPLTYNLDPAALETALTPATRAVMPVHLYGHPADMDPILEFARAHELKVIEDACQAHGAFYRGRAVGTFGDAACFSFYPGKNLGAWGDGGAVVTQNASLAERVRILRNHGQREKYFHLAEGYCDRLDNLQAAVLGAKLPHLAEWNAARRQAAAWYAELLSDVPRVRTPVVADEVEHVFHLYVVEVEGRDTVQQTLAQAGIETGIHYPIPLHEQPAYASLGYRPDDFPVTHAASHRILSLPMFPEITREQVEFVSRELSAVAARTKS